MIIGGDGPWIPAPNHSLLVYFGPEVAMVLLGSFFSLLFRRPFFLVRKLTLLSLFTSPQYSPFRLPVRLIPSRLEQSLSELTFNSTRPCFLLPIVPRGRKVSSAAP